MDLVIDDGSKAYTFRTDHGKKKHFIGIEGTTRNVADFVMDGKAFLERDAILGFPTHRGFAAVARAVYDDLMAHQRLKPGYTVGLTGHSLGGAAAVLLGMYLGEIFILLDPGRLEFANQDIERPFIVTIRDDFKNVVEKHQAFSGHLMDDYEGRLKEQWTEPWRYSTVDTRYCPGKGPSDASAVPRVPGTSTAR